MAFPQSLAPRLPYDIVISIIEDLLAESRDSSECIDVLQTFSLISQSYVAFCQKRLFRRFNMGRTDAKKCFSILQQSPHLIPYVEEVWMYLGQSRGLVNVTVVEMELLRVLTSLRHLTVVAKASGISWGVLSLSVRRTITSLLLPFRITSLVMVGVHDLPDGLLTAWRHLKSLSIWKENPRDGLHDSDDSDPASEDEIAYTQFGNTASYFAEWATDENDVAIQLETLSLLDADDILLSVLVYADMLNKDELILAAPPEGSPDPNRARGLANSQTYGLFQAKYKLPPFFFDFSLLREFTIDIIETNLLPAFSVIHHARDTLKTLDIRQRYLPNVQQDPFGFDSSVDESLEPLPKRVSLDSLVHLQHLSLTILILTEYNPLQLNPLSSWCALLRRAPRGIRTLAITLDCFFIQSVRSLLPWFPDLDDDDDTATTPLRPLDEVISNPELFPNLDYLSFRVRLPDDDAMSTDESMTDDVVEEYDFPALQAWLDEHRQGQSMADTTRRTSPLAGASTAADVVMDDAPAVQDPIGAAPEPVPSSSANNASWPSGMDPDIDDNSSNAYPLQFEQVCQTVVRMMRLTRELVVTHGEGIFSLVVHVEFGAHPDKDRDWGYGNRRRVDWIDDTFAFK